MNLVVRPDGRVALLYDERLDLASLGHQTIRRASYVEPDQQGRWWADLAAMSGPRLGPFDRRSQALAAEVDWLEQRLLSRDGAPHA